MVPLQLNLQFGRKCGSLTVSEASTFSKSLNLGSLNMTGAASVGDTLFVT